MDDMQRMGELLQQHFTCSQILLALGLDAQGKSDPDLIRAMHGLAMGIGGTGNICGTLSGGACLIALYAGRGSATEPEDPRLGLMITELVEWFTETYGQLYGGICCENILADDPRNVHVRCPDIILATYEKAKELLSANGIAFYGKSA